MHKMQFCFGAVFATVLVTFVTSLPSVPNAQPAHGWLRSGRRPLPFGCGGVSGAPRPPPRSSLAATVSLSLLRSIVCSAVLKDFFGLVLAFTSLGSSYSSGYSFLNTEGNEPKMWICFHTSECCICLKKRWRWKQPFSTEQIFSIWL